MASISMDVLRMAAELYRQPGMTWSAVAKALRKQGHHHHRAPLQERCRAEGLLASPGHSLCPLCKGEFKKPEGLAWSYCDDCKAGRLPVVMATRRRRFRSRGAYA